MTDEQVGNNSYITMTPGSAVAGQLQNILTQRRLEARQDMLDKLKVRDDESMMAYRDQNAKSLEADRESKIEDRKAQQLSRITSNLSPGTQFNDKTGENYQFIKRTAPELIKPGEHATAPLAPGEVGPQRPEIPESFVGTPDQLEKSRKTKLQEDAIQALNAPDFKDKPTHIQAQIYKLATGSEPAQGVINPKSDDYVPVLDDKGNTINWAQSNAKFAPKDPVTPAALQTPIKYDVDAPDPEDPTKTVIESHWLKPGEQPTPQNKIGLRVHKGEEKPPPRGGVGSSVEISPTIVKQIAGLKGRITPKPTMFGLSQSTPKPDDVTAYNSTLATTIMNLKTSDQVKAVAQNILKDPNASHYTPEELVALRGGNLTPAEKSHLKVILGALQ